MSPRAVRAGFVGDEVSPAGLDLRAVNRQGEDQHDVEVVHWRSHVGNVPSLRWIHPHAV